MWAVYTARMKISLTLLAETVGFEPTVPIKGRLVSSEVLSTTQPRLQAYKLSLLA